MNFYAILGISHDADDRAIRQAYRMLVRRYHPDLGSGSSAEKFRQVREAYETLINPATRRSYDLSLKPAIHYPAARVEPLAAPARPCRQEDPLVFGTFAPRVQFSLFQRSAFDRVFAGWLHSPDE